MTITVTATTATDWPLYNYLKYARNSALPLNAVGLTILVVDNNDPGVDAYDRRMTITGTGLATDAFGNIVGGTITSIKIANLPPAGAATYYTMTFSPTLGATTLW